MARRRESAKCGMVAAGKTEMLEATEIERSGAGTGERGRKGDLRAAPARTFPLFYRGETFLEFGCLVSRLTSRAFAFY